MFTQYIALILCHLGILLKDINNMAISGLESGGIEDDKMTASSSYSSSVKPSMGRLHGDDGGGA